MILKKTFKGGTRTKETVAVVRPKSIPNTGYSTVRAHFFKEKSSYVLECGLGPEPSPSRSRLFIAARARKT